MQKRTIHNLVWIPVFLIGLAALFLGLEWCFHPEPWLLDQRPNEALLQTSFSTLFAEEINAHLPAYLKVIYRFFGFWVLLIGLFLINFSMPSMIINVQIRNRILFLVGIMLIFGLYLGYIWIPSSHFIGLTWILFIVYLFSLFGMIKLTYENK